MQPSLAERIRRSRVRPLKYLLRRCLRPKTVDIGGVRMIADPSRIGFRAVKSLYHGDYEAPERLIVSEVVKLGDKVLEAGAGMGLITLTLARIVGAENVVSYEPMPAAYSLLADNARLNDFAIDHRPRALAATGGSVKFYADGNVVASSLYSRSNTNLIEVQADGIAETLRAEKSNVLVLDIEGAEIELLKACPLNGVRKIVMEVHPHIVGEEATGAMIAQLENAGLHPDPALAAGRVMAFLR